MYQWGGGGWGNHGGRSLSHQLTHFQTGEDLGSKMGQSLRYPSKVNHQKKTFMLQVNWMAAPEGEEGGQVMFEWEEQDRFSFEDSDRFEEVAVTSSYNIISS